MNYACPHCHQGVWIEFYRPRIYCQACGGCSAMHMNSLVPIWQEGPPPIIQAVQTTTSTYTIKPRRKARYGWVLVMFAWIFGGIAGLACGWFLLKNYIQPLYDEGFSGILVNEDAHE